MLHPPRRPGILAKLALLSFVPLTLLALVEFTISALDVAPPRRGPLVVMDQDQFLGVSHNGWQFRFSPRWLWEPKPGVEVFGAPINEGGYRGPLYPEERTAKLRVATLGDSSTYGFGLPEAVSWSRKLEELLGRFDHDVEVLNFGVIGFTLAQGLALYEGRVREYQPDVVIVAFGAVNDQFATPSGLTDRQKILLSSGSSFRLRTFLRRFGTFRWLESRLVDAEERAAIIETKASHQRVPPHEFQELIGVVKDRVTADGAKLLVVSPPRRRDGEAEYPITRSYTMTLLDRSLELDLPVVDVLGFFRRYEERVYPGIESDLQLAKSSDLFIDKFHPSEKGHEAWASLVAKALIDEGLLVRRGDG